MASKAIEKYPYNTWQETQTTGLLLKEKRFKNFYFCLGMRVQSLFGVLHCHCPFVDPLFAELSAVQLHTKGVAAQQIHRKHFTGLFIWMVNITAVFSVFTSRWLRDTQTCFFYCCYFVKKKKHSEDLRENWTRTNQCNHHPLGRKTIQIMAAPSTLSKMAGLQFTTNYIQWLSLHIRQYSRR